MIRKLTCTAIAGLLAMSSALTAQELTIQGPATLDKEGVVEISGAGFEADAPVLLLFTTADGVAAEIGYALDPQPVADADGNWTTTWSYGRFVSKKLVAPGDFNLAATDEDLNELATTTITFTE
ncbi:hypothetical protein GCM10016455_09020 [Aliiroseovarius zhejiangensis]|uniref:DUF2141 domain-containing protein n=1 Tax=Aliiroseovarius zhejiangensis TaxID=1632025 RepID=A0ABQ3ITL6_9RHOB|nr:hypothetical protein [Aliiroseovarius zhejiangensis]GHE90808.1 hypothetical protein GCM10016455_09020 [Aliiroseovarius zhejiangensis]